MRVLSQKLVPDAARLPGQKLASLPAFRNHAAVAMLVPLSYRSSFHVAA
jgi:hypothetical protein